jgi:hypothetical protein
MSKKVKEKVAAAVHFVKEFVGVGETVYHVGIPAPEEPILPVGISRVTCNGYLSIGFINDDGETLSMFTLNPGTHIIRRPSDVHVILQCEQDTQWFVYWPGRFDRSDSTKISETLIRPRSSQEEMADYLNEMIARVSSRKSSEMLRSGKAEIDFSDEDYEDDSDDYDSPLSVHQMSLIMDVLEADIKAKHKKSSTPPAQPGEPGAADKNNQVDIEEAIEQDKAKDSKPVEKVVKKSTTQV